MGLGGAERRKRRRQFVRNSGGTFISSVTSANFHRHNVARLPPVRYSPFLSILSASKGVPQNRRNGTSFNTVWRVVCISCYLSTLSFVVVVGPFSGKALLTPFVIIDRRRCYRRIGSGDDHELPTVQLNLRLRHYVEFFGESASWEALSVCQSGALLVKSEDRFLYYLYLCNILWHF